MPTPHFPKLGALLATLALVASDGPAARAGTNPPAFEPLPGQRLWLKGDSITKGFGFGNYTDPSPLRTIHGIAGLLMRENLPHPPAMGALPFVWAGLNSDGTPKTVDSLAGEIKVNIRAGDLRPGDWLIYEDAGELDKIVSPAPWPNARDIYRRYREGLRGMVLEAQGATDRDRVRFMTMFDYEPRIPWCRWDAPLDDGVHTGNDAIRDEAAALGVRVIDMNRIMDRAHEYVAGAGWGRMVGPDGIHPNVYGNFVMALAILESLGADIAHWRLDSLGPRFRHPAAGGDVPAIWGFTKDPTDAERMKILEDLRAIVVRETKARPSVAAAKVTRNAGGAGAFYPTAHTFQRMLRHGRVLDRPAVQPAGTDQPASYEIGKLFQLDADTALLVVAMREQGGHDFEIGNDGFVFRQLAEIVPERAIPINRLEADYVTRAGEKAVLAKYPVNGAIVPLGAKREDGTPHPAAGTGFLCSTALTFTADRAEITVAPDQFVEFYQVRWDGAKLQVERDRLPESYAARLINVGFNSLPLGDGFLCPVVSDEGIEVLRFAFEHGRWRPVESGGNFATIKKPARLALEPSKQGVGGKKFAAVRGEIEPSLARVPGGFICYTRGPDPRGRVYRSQDGLHYYLQFDNWNHTVPQSMNQGLDGSIYLATNRGPGLLRNPLVAFALRGQSFVDPIIVHDERQIGDDKGAAVPFCDHAMGANLRLGGRWRHLLAYRVCDLRETNGQGAAPTPQTGLYLAEFEYGGASQVPFRF
ncbi:MAG: hypothetical protein ABIQ12_03385 [Opitutaceae bacterium]